MSIDVLFNEPFFEGNPATSSNPQVPWEFPVALGGHAYLAELSLYERATVDYRREASDTETEPGEHSLSTRGAWRRTGSEWTFGAGQEFWDKTASDRTRFRTSKGVDIFSEQHRISLLHDTREIRNSANANLEPLSVSGRLYTPDGTALIHTNNPENVSPTWADSDIHAGESPVTVNDITTDGTVIYAALGANGIHKTSLGSTTSTSLTTFAATIVQYANGRLIAADGDEVFEVAAAGTVTTIKDHDNASFIWQTISSSPAGIYVAGNAGDRAEIYFVGVDEETGALKVPIWASGLPDGETINVALFYEGVMLLGTSRGLRVALIRDDNGLNYAAPIEIDNGVTALEPQGEDCWFSWTNFDGLSTGLGRARLSRTTAPLVPVYASDLMATETGVVSGIATVADKRYFSIASKGLYAEFDNLVASGTLSQGFIDFGTIELKTAVSIDLRHRPLYGTIRVDLVLDDDSEVPVGTSQTAGTTGPTAPFDVPGTKTNEFEVKLTFIRSATDATLGPTLHRWTFRALVNPLRLDAWSVPLHFREKLTMRAPGDADGEERAFDCLEEFIYLKQLEATGAPVRYQEGTSSYNVQIENVIAPQDKDREWTRDRSFPQGLVVVRMVSVNAIV
jgi:hypothetical protein